MDLREKQILYAVSSMGLGHVYRSLPIIRHLLAAGSRLLIVSHGRALETLKLELAGHGDIEYIAFPDYPPIQRGRGVAHYVYLMLDLLATGRLIKQETTLLKQLLAKRHIDLVISDGRFGFESRHLPCFLICHQIRFILPQWLRLFQPLSDLGQYLMLRKFTKIIVPDFADPKTNLTGTLSHNWMASRLNAVYIGFLSSVRKVPVSQHTDIVFITGGFIEVERKRITEWARQHLNGSGQKIKIVLGNAKTEEGVIDNGCHYDVYSSIHGEERDRLLSSARVLVGRTGYTTIMDACELGIHAALTPTPYMTEQEYLARHLALLNHPVSAGIPLENGMTWVGFDGNAAPPLIREWSTEKTLKRLGDFLTRFDHE